MPPEACGWWSKRQLPAPVKGKARATRWLQQDGVGGGCGGALRSAGCITGARPDRRRPQCSRQLAPDRARCTQRRAADQHPNAQSAAGVSRNVYNQFNVGPNGAILNNSRTNVQTQLGGFVQGNPYLATGPARIILNEVNGGSASQLRGYIEVGRPACRSDHCQSGRHQRGRRRLHQRESRHADHGHAAAQCLGWARQLPRARRHHQHQRCRASMQQDRLRGDILRVPWKPMRASGPAN
jgi:filamentous hemagglutinin family protein